MTKLTIIIAIFTLVSSVTPQSIDIKMSLDIQKQKIAKAIELDEKAQVEATAVVNNEVTIARALSTAVTEVGIYIGTQMVQDLFQEGIQLVKNANEVLKKTDFTSGVNIDISINTYALVAVNAFKECVANNSILNNLNQYFLNLASRLVKINTDAFNFKVQIAQCATRNVDLAGQTDTCINSIKLKYPYPVVPPYTIDTAAGVKALVGCVDYAAGKLNVAGSVTINQLLKFLPAASRYLVPAKFDTRPQGATIVADTTSYIPNAKINEVQLSLKRAENLVRLANRDKLLNFFQARFILRDLTGPYYNAVSNITLPLTAQYCKVTAEIAGQTNLNLKSSSMISCIARIENPPSQFSYNLLENAFIEKELKERLFIPTVDCSKDLHNAFNLSRIQTCLKSSEINYWTLLNTTQLTAEMYSANALIVRKLVKKCQCNAEIELQKQMKVDLWNLETCIMQATKKRPNIPKINFCVSSSTCRYANVSAEVDEGEIIVDDSNVTTTTMTTPTVEDRFGDNSTTTPPTTPITIPTPATPPPTPATPSPTPATPPPTPATPPPTPATPPPTPATPPPTPATPPPTPATSPPTPATTPRTPTTQPTTRKPLDDKVCTVFNGTFGEFGCGETVKYPRDIITPAQFWSSDISWEL